MIIPLLFQVWAGLDDEDADCAASWVFIFFVAGESFFAVAEPGLVVVRGEFKLGVRQQEPEPWSTARAPR